MLKNRLGRRSGLLAYCGRLLMKLQGNYLGQPGKIQPNSGLAVGSGRIVMSDGETSTRRTFLTRAGLAAVSAGLIVRSRNASAQTPVPNSSGTASPTLLAPPNTCDCHHHIYDAVRFPPPANSSNPMVVQARAEEYQLLKQRLRTTRNVIVTPAVYVTDNRVTLDAIARLGTAARGVAVVRPEVTDAELKAMDRGGIRGIRFSLNQIGRAHV